MLPLTFLHNHRSPFSGSSNGNSKFGAANSASVHCCFWFWFSTTEYSPQTVPTALRKAGRDKDEHVPTQVAMLQMHIQMGEPCLHRLP